MLEAREEARELRADRITFGRLRLPRAHELAFDLARTIVDRPSEGHGRLTVDLKVRQQTAGRDFGQVDDQVDAIGLDLDR